MVVYAVGEVDYDVRTALPSAIFSTLEAAQGYVHSLWPGRDVVWDEKAPGGTWDGIGHGCCWSIQRYVVDGSLSTA